MSKCKECVFSSVRTKRGETRIVWAAIIGPIGVLYKSLWVTNKFYCAGPGLQAEQQAVRLYMCHHHFLERAWY